MKDLLREQMVHWVFAEQTERVICTASFRNLRFLNWLKSHKVNIDRVFSDAAFWFNKKYYKAELELKNWRNGHIKND